jgi:hypothetical protein
MFSGKLFHTLSRFLDPEKYLGDETPGRFPRRALIKGAVGGAISALIADRFASPGAAFTEFLPYDPERDAHYGHRYGWIEHHRPSSDATGEKFVFVRLKYPGGDWYTDIVDYYRWPADVKFAQVLAQETSIDVELHGHAQYVSIDDAYIFEYPYLYMTGHIALRFSDEQVQRLRDYLERGGFLYTEDCDIRLNNGEGRMRPALYRLMKRVFPDKTFERLDMSHPIYHTLYDHDEYLGGDKLVEPNGTFDEVIFIDDRIVVYFCPSDLSCAWEGHPCSPGGEEQRRWAFEQGINIVAYAFSH